ncbi:glycosyltransferase family A protein [Paraburkholderia graminis]|jgi:glycosyltransferase involved in cell wall biosynthesis|uniref:Glycosyltransferase involved in cell wall biosynthesis n=1 Tax=Paraburkholderia graminis TaxID=60548 RepID=A0ABD5CI26_9BURK|nr:glycosyltransferase family A protein [Paraburkholderia graminis]MDQ0625675.1 glycosyltransferase involved in cell wall biosynthesis [Paraburkholderia graminis]MDR6204200.1 glycosyltransferase involved in cell wall biosynthesis [Paraburkholderia graminis]
MKEMNVVICNYNYEEYLAQAIDSALAQDYMNTHVIVIDDGSTDGSRAIMQAYATRITTIFKDNGGQVSAYNLALQRLKTGYVLFLDSDDVLYPGAVTEVMQSFQRENVAKVQFRLDVIDCTSKCTGVYVPHSLADGDCLKPLLDGWLYPSPPASGNAYSVSALRKIFPVPETAKSRYGADFYAIYGAALVGTVLSIPKSLGGYRVYCGARGATFANSEQTDRAPKAFTSRWATLREIASRRLGMQLPRDFHDFALERAYFCASVYNAPLTARWRWMLKHSHAYLHAIVANPFWSLKKKLGTLALSSLCLVPYSPIADYAVRYICNPLARNHTAKKGVRVVSEARATHL